VDLKSNVEAVVKFTILYSKDRDAFVSDCEKIEREVEQSVAIEIPQEVIGLLQNLGWAEKLDLVISLSGHSAIDLRDKEVKNAIVSNKNPSRKRWWFLLH